jgi:hypothetical protein
MQLKWLEMLMECASGLPVTSEAASLSLVVHAIFNRKPDGYEAIRFSSGRLTAQMANFLAESNLNRFSHIPVHLGRQPKIQYPPSIWTEKLIQAIFGQPSICG